MQFERSRMGDVGRFAIVVVVVVIVANEDVFAIKLPITTV